MTVSRIHVFSEPDLVHLLEGEPELLAVADAIAETYPQRRRRSWPLRVAVAAVAAAVGVGVLAVAPWRGGHGASLVDRALAAVGGGPVVHAVLEPETGRSLVSIDLATGKERTLVTTTEIWLDQKRELEHTIVRVDGRLQDEILQRGTDFITPQGRNLHAPPPWVDPALSEFVDRYREALGTGKATPAGEGSVDGRPVGWLTFALGNGATERVAIDKETSLPVRVETDWGHGGRPDAYTVRTIGTLPEESGDFAPPQVVPGPQPESYMREPTPIAPEAATKVIPGALAVGSSFRGLPLVKVVETKLSTLFKHEEHAEPLVSRGLEFDYGSDSLVDGRAHLLIAETTEPQTQNGWLAAPPPEPGTLLVSELAGIMSAGPGTAGLMVKDGLYITILASDRDLLLASTRALEPFSP